MQTGSYNSENTNREIKIGRCKSTTYKAEHTYWTIQIAKYKSETINRKLLIRNRNMEIQNGNTIVIYKSGKYKSEEQSEKYKSVQFTTGQHS